MGFLLDGRELGTELAAREIFQGAEAGVEFGGREAPLAVEIAEVIGGGMLTLAEVAFHTAGNQVAVGIFSRASAGHDVVEALQLGGSAAKAVKTRAAFAIVNGFAERPSTEEIGGLEGRGRGVLGSSGRAIEEVASGVWRATSKDVTFGRAEGEDLLGQAHLDEVAGFAAFEQAQSAQLIEAANRLAHWSVGKTEIAGYVHNRKVQAELADDEGMAQQVGIDSAVPDGEAETRGEHIFKLHPEEFDVHFFGLHVFVLARGR